MIATVDEADEGLKELILLKDTLLHEGHFYLSRWDRQRYSNINTQALIPSVVLVALEIANRLKDFDMRNAPDMELEELIKYVQKWNWRLEAHAEIVLAYQAKGDKADNPEAMEALAVYESLAGKYEAPGFETGLMEARFMEKYGANKPSAGKVPEELKANANLMGRLPFNFSHDQLLRAIHFGMKEPEWQKHARKQATEEARAEAERLIGAMFEDPWSLYEAELRLLGVSKDDSYGDAYRAFRKGVLERRVVFNSVGEGFNEATKEVAAFIIAWKKLGPLYAAKLRQEATV